MVRRLDIVVGLPFCQSKFERHLAALAQRALGREADDHRFRRLARADQRAAGGEGRGREPDLLLELEHLARVADQRDPLRRVHPGGADQQLEATAPRSPHRRPTRSRGCAPAVPATSTTR